MTGLKVFAWHDVRTVSKSLTFQYDKILYLMDPTEENSRLAGEKIKVLDYAPSSPTVSHPRMPMISLKLRLILIDTSLGCYRSVDFTAQV